MLGSFVLAESEGERQPIIDASFADLGTLVHLREGSTALKVTLDSFSVTDYHTVPGKELAFVSPRTLPKP